MSGRKRWREAPMPMWANRSWGRGDEQSDPERTDSGISNHGPPLPNLVFYPATRESQSGGEQYLSLSRRKETKPDCARIPIDFFSPVAHRPPLDSNSSG